MAENKKEVGVQTSHTVTTTDNQTMGKERHVHVYYI